MAILQTLEKHLDQFIESSSEGRTSFIRSKIHAEPWPKDIFRLPRFQSHRGYWRGGARQNSIASLAEAASKGSQMCEFDVRLTKDKVPVLFHDEDLSAEGFPEMRVDELTLSELRAKVPVDTLRQVLRKEGLTPYFNIEIKSEKVLDEPLERYIADVVREEEAEGRILFSSFNPFSLWKVTGFLPNVPRAFLVSPDMKERSLREMWFAPLLKIHMLNLDDQMITPENMAEWRALNVPVAVWTVNDENRIAELYGLGVDSVISDLPPVSL